MTVEQENQTASSAVQTRRRCGHTEHTIGFTGKFLGRYSAHAPIVGGGWEPCTAGPHHEHQVGHGDYADVECCICPGTPCGGVTVADMLAHREYDRKQERASGVVDARFAISAAITEALDDVPENTLDQAAENAWRTCWLIARGDVDEPPF
jgi:hypothetical protein